MIQLSKKMQEPITMCTNDTFSPQGLFHLTSIDIIDVQLSVERLFDPTNHQTEEASSIFLKIISGNLEVKVDEEFSKKMERITKKKPPDETKVQIIFTEFDNSCVSRVFKDLLPYPKQGKIYIGFPTHQTTGCCSHLSARLIPTVCIYIGILSNLLFFF